MASSGVWGNILLSKTATFVVIDRGGGFKVFFKPISKCSCCLTYILFITFQPVTFESICNTTFVGHVVFIFWSHQFIFHGLATVEMNLNAISLANVLQKCENVLQIKNICKRYGIQVHFNSGKTLKDELVAPKDKDHMTNKSGIIYRFKCDRLECDEEYIGETARTFGDRFKEHHKAPSPLYDHSNTTGHTTNINNFSIVGREEQNLSRLIKESMFIRVNNPSLNKNIGKYHLPHVWDEVLINNLVLKLK